MRPYDDGELEAYTVAPLSGAGRARDGPAVTEPHEYKELKAKQGTLD